MKTPHSTPGIAEYVLIVLLVLIVLAGAVATIGADILSILPSPF